MSELIPEQYRHDEEIIRLTVAQIKKDFGSHLPEIITTGNSSALFDELKIQIAEALKLIYKNSKNDLQVLLYRVDIKEADAKIIFSTTSSFLPLAEKIIQREFQKVLTRKFFSS